MKRKTNWQDIAVTIGFVLLGLLGILFVIAAWAGILLIPVLLLMWAWNTFAAEVFGLPAITFWQALALALLLSTVKGIFNLKRSKKGNDGLDD